MMCSSHNRLCIYHCFFFFFKQKTAYELRISDWSSDVCSSDLTSFAAKWLVPRLGRFATAHPDIEVRLAINDVLLDFASDAVDVGIRYGGGAWRGLHAERLMTEVVFVVCSPKQIGRAHV